ncbi:MAG: HAMP domain-containing histidine kinase [Anaerolineales bacterium]|nr:HAMP domain-containing histidine kinase [Anaerolineales bacterium]
MWRQLKWRIVGGNMAVVIAGATLVLLMTQIVTRTVVPEPILAEVRRLAEASDPAGAEAATAVLLETFRGTIISAVLVGTIGAIVVGWVSSLALARQILHPLNQLASSSQRIANGRYDERIPIPDSDELAGVATHFNQMAQALATIEEQRITLIGNVSHELRTPLTSMIGFLEGLMDGLFPSSEETYAPMHAEMQRMQRLVDDLQTLSRVEAGAIEMQKRPFLLCLTVQQVLTQLQPQLVAGQLQAVVEGREAPVFVHADPDRTAQVLLNLLSNAIRYTPPHGTITVYLRCSDQLAQVAVQDTGAGIPDNALPLLFERFYRVDQSRARRSGGSGIGLTISRRLVWAMGGDMTAQSDGLGRGSTFTFTLPLATKPDS